MKHLARTVTCVGLSIAMLLGCARSPHADLPAVSSTKAIDTPGAIIPGARIHNGDFQYAEYWGTAHGLDAHIVILPAGGARVDLQRRGEPIRTVITPVSPVEADRMVRVLNALDQSMFDYKPGMIVSCQFRARSSGGERTIKVGPRPKESSHVVAGLVDEICEIGFVDVAAAIESADYAQVLMAQGHYRDAIWPNCGAIEMFDAWWMRYPQRYNYVNIDLFKYEHSFPEVETRPVPLTDEEYQQAKERLKAGGDAATTIADVSASSFDHELRAYFSVRREGQNITSIAQVRKNDMRLDAGKAGIGSGIPPEALEILRDPRWLDWPPK